MLARDALLGDEPLATAEALDAMRQHAVEAYPNEAVGFLLTDGTYSPQENICSEPTKGATVDPKKLLKVLKAGTLRAFFHSHPDGPDCPSRQDMLSQAEQEVPWIICSANAEASLPPFAFGDELTNPAPLIGRPFRHGVTDCYAAIRAWAKQERGVELPDFPRNWEWWLDGESDLYRDYFGTAGFYPIEAHEVRPGDGWLAQIRSPVPNHAGLYIGDGLVFHHVSSALASDPARLSKREPLGRWQPYITQWVRRDDLSC